MLLGVIFKQGSPKNNLFLDKWLVAFHLRENGNIISDFDITATKYNICFRFLRVAFLCGTSHRSIVYRKKYIKSVNDPEESLDHVHVLKCSLGRHFAPPHKFRVLFEDAPKYFSRSGINMHCLLAGKKKIVYTSCILKFLLHLYNDTSFVQNIIPRLYIHTTLIFYSS